MMKYHKAILIICSLFILVPLVNGQTIKANYSVESFPDLSKIENSVLDSLPPGAKEFFLTKMAMDLGFSISVDVFMDTAYIKYSNLGDDRINFVWTDYLLTRSRLFRLDTETNELKEGEAPDTALVYTGNAKYINGFECKEMSDQSGSLRIWVCETLSPLLNPGINVVAPGAILAYSRIDKKGTTTGRIVSLEMNPEVI